MAIGRSIVRLGLGSGLAQLGQLFFIPILGRNFSPAAYGLYVLFVGFAAVGAVFAGLRYDAAIVLPKRGFMAEALAALVLLLSLVVAGVVLAATALVTWTVDASDGVDWAVFGLGFAAMMPLQALQRIYAAWMARSGKFGSSGALQFCIVMGTIILQLALHFAGKTDVVALIGGAVLSLAVTLLAFSRSVIRELTGTLRLITRFRPIWLAAHRYQRFPRFTILYGLSSTLRERLVHMEFGGIAGLQALGRFAMGVRLVGSPNTLLYAGIGPVFYAHASRVTKEAVARDAAAILELTLAALAPVYVVVALNAEPLVERLLGASWSGTGTYVAVLCLPYLAQTVTSWFDRAYDVYHNQKTALILDALFTVTLIVSVAGSLHFLGPIAGAVCYAIVSGLYCGLWMPITYRANGLDARLLIRPAIVAASFVAGWVIATLVLQKHLPLVTQLAVEAAGYMLSIVIYVYRFGGARKIGSLFQ